MTTTAQAPLWQPYCGAAPDPAHWLAHWNWDPVLLAVLAGMLGVGFVMARARAWSQLGVAATMLVLFVSPLCALGSALFVARSVHHLALVLVVAPLLVAAVGQAAFPKLSLTGATVIQTAIFWLWHVPAFYERAMSADLVFWAMQLSITISAAIWWTSLRRAGTMEAAAGVLAQMVQMGVLGALLVFAGRAFYAPHAHTTAAWGLSALEDQQLAGLMMWVVGGGAYLLIATVVLWRALAPSAEPRSA
ncbi:cytochrome c oxidase assembly protein [Sphingomonas floccifaciens]|uniref:Cytochrome c oxidase assembly protein n=1 Tax=Sphingomonas floccifaciens TaxID=1844115 RepID=A0ABW4N883_9SPHN